MFQVVSVSGNDALTFSLGTSDGSLLTGPGSTAISTAGLSDYINGGVILINPHPVLQWKAESRERQINIGGEDLNSVAGYSDDGKYVIVTSQGKANKGGGNSVMIFEIKYRKIG